tara:strand:+ start:632 stop:769 length:138 start_codon:yes stop_codon:yes gene_type:complete
VVLFVFVFVCILRFVIKNYQHGLIEHILPLVFLIILLLLLAESPT